MGSFSTVHWLVVAVVVLILFGSGRLSSTMGEFGKGIRNFRKGLAEGDVEHPEQHAKSALTGTSGLDDRADD